MTDQPTPMAIEVNQVLRATGARLPHGSPSTEFRGAFVDSREVVEGALFVGVRGERADGGLYAWEVLRAGAAAAVVTESTWRWVEGDVRSLRKPVIVSNDPVGVLQAAGRIALERSGARVVGVTGAVGKTTTKDILVAALRAAGVRVHGSVGNRNTEIGVPLTLLELADDTEVAVIEMGMRGTGQIAELARLAPPDVACVTSIGPVHLELLGTVAAVAASKAEILQALRPGGAAVVPDDEPLLEPYVAALPDGVRVLRFGAEPARPLGLPTGAAWLRYNAAAALACCEALGRVPPADVEIPVALSPLRGAETGLAGGGVLIEDCYNANPLAVAAALRDLARRNGGRRVAVLADMKELGPDEARYHREAGALAGELRIDVVVGVGPLGALIADGAGGAAETLRFHAVEDCVAGLAAHLRPGDAVLLKGSRSMALERVGAAVKAALPA